MFSLRICLKSLFVSICFLLACMHNIQAQEFNRYELDKTNFDLGLSAGTALFIYTDVQLSLHFTRRITKLSVVEAKPLTGLITQLLIFEGNHGRYRIPYFGGTLGVNLGKQLKFFEVTLGPAYFIDPQSAWGDSSSNLYLIGSIGYRKINRNNTFRVGLGFPSGLYLSILF